MLIASFIFVPEWSTVVENGEFAFLPEDAPSVEAERLFRMHFPDQSGSSNIVLVLSREGTEKGLSQTDFDFIGFVLVPKLCDLFQLDLATGEAVVDDGADPAKRRLVKQLNWSGTKYIGSLYNSVDAQASLVVLELQTEFLDQDNDAVIDRLQAEILEIKRLDATAPPGEAFPQGLEIAFTGTATYGRDSIREAERSGKSTERWTVILVVVLLLVMYRAPLLALIPLLTVAVAATLSMNLLAIGAKLGWVRLFNGIEPYVTVLVYGAGVDYCLFLIARYREELDVGNSIDDSVRTSLTRVGSALAASAGTTMCGIAMMAFADFGKFQQAGIAISFSLFVCLCTTLTLAPAVLRLFGKWAFWPNVPVSQAGEGESESESRPGRMSRLMNLHLLTSGWKSVGHVLVRKPGTFWIGSILAMAPFAVAGIALYGYLSYGLLTDLPATSDSVQGAQALQAHFPGGEGVPVRVLLDVPGQDYAKKRPKAPDDITEFTDRIVDAREQLGIQAVRSLADPTGGQDLGIQKRLLWAKALRDYSTDVQPSVTRLDLIFTNDAFSRSSIDEFRHLREELPKLLPESMKGATLSFSGQTASLSDLKTVTDRDRTVVNSLVTAAVFLILWILLKRLWLCGYLIVTVLFSYFATLGCTFLFYWALDPSGFAGLDWKVPMFLFTILIAVGEDYNIFLITRIEEESKTHGPINGIVVALERTGGIISSCGIIMAGTFSSLMAGSLVGMDQLGFALAVGVFLDTFVVRPIMVPAFLIMLAKRKQSAAEASA